MVCMVCLVCMVYMVYMVCIVCGSCRVYRAAITDTFYSEELIAANYKTDTLWPHWTSQAIFLL